jgi:hypothetical protein
VEGKDTVIIHSYVTDGFYDFAVTLIESFKNKHGEDMPFLLHGKELSNEQIEGLYKRYKNLTIKNSEIDWVWLERMSKMSKKQLLQGKHQVEHLGNRYMSKQFYHWKHYISIYSRYRDAIAEAFEFAGEGEHILHLDIDLYINRDLTPIFNLIEMSDVAIMLRPQLSPEWRKVYGCILGFTVNDRSRKFIKKVRTHIHAKDFINIPKGYGQIVFWRAWQDFRKTKEIKFAKIPETWIDKGFGNKALILSANNGLKKHQTKEKYHNLRKAGR